MALALVSTRATGGAGAAGDEALSAADPPRTTAADGSSQATIAAAANGVVPGNSAAAEKGVAPANSVAAAKGVAPANSVAAAGSEGSPSNGGASGARAHGVAAGAAGPGATEPLPRAYVDACERGNARFAQHDFTAAIASYREAIAARGQVPLGYYLLGEAELAIGSLAEAETAWQRALSESDHDPPLRARTLFVLADLKETQRKWEEAKTAWQSYLDWMREAKANGFESSARSRQEAIERMTRQDRAYAVVRQRIRETSDGGVFSTVTSESAPP